MPSSAPETRLRSLVTVHPLDSGWELRRTAPGDSERPDGLGEDGWAPARVPGTVAAAVPGADDLDASDWWFRTSFAAEPAQAGEEVLLRLGGIATVAEVFLNGELVLRSDSMFLEHSVDVGGLLGERNELHVRCLALGPLLAERRKPRARWRTKLVSEGNLRFFRTMLLGRCPGFAAGPPAVGPWRPVTLERRTAAAVDELALRPRLEGDDGRLAISAGVRGTTTATVEVEGPTGAHRGELTVDGGVLSGELTIPGVATWWPHTHGEPALYRVSLRDGDGAVLHTSRVGFRELVNARPDDLALQVNGRPVFARGALWTPAEWPGLAPSEDELRRTLEHVRDAGMNMVRLPGTGTYETAAFHDLCDELGLLVWQDFMFANLDYPIADDGFRALVEEEAKQVLGRIAGRPSTAVLCGNSEIEQQVAMLGLDPELGRGELFGELLPELAAQAGADAIYLPSAPSGGDLPFRSDRGVANYFGVGGYRRPLEDARRAEVRFASECLALSNVPDEASVPVHDPRWKQGVPRDAGSGWDFEDVRDHYLELLYGVDPVRLRSVDHARYLELSQAVTGEVMSATFSEWRRAGSPCQGGLVLWLRDLVAGAGWGLLDHRGDPKVALRHVGRALAPVAVSMTAEGLNGVDVHVANDRSGPVSARLRVALYRNLEQPVEQGEQEIEVGAHDALRFGVEELVGRFVDADWAYRFGPPGHDAIVATLEGEGGMLSQAFHFPAGPPSAQWSSAALGLTGEASEDGGGGVRLIVRSTRLAYGVRVAADGFRSSDDAFSVEPGGERHVRLLPMEAGAQPGPMTLTALNLEGRVRVAAA